MTQTSLEARDGVDPPSTAPGAAPSAGGRDRIAPLYFTLPFANVALWLVWMGAGSFLIPIQVMGITGDTDPDALKNASAIGAALAAIGNPLFGQLSDRTRSRFGRRTPWVLACAGMAALALIGQAKADSILMLGLTWGTVQFILNGYQAGITAAMPDRVPPAKYGIFSGLIGLASPIAILLTAFVIGGVDMSRLGGDGVLGGFGGKFTGANGYYLLAGAVVLGALVFAFVSPEPSSKGMAVEKFVLKDFLAGFWVSPRKYPDFAWAFLSRFGVMTGYFITLIYSYFMLIDYVKVPEEDVNPVTGYLLVVSAAATIVASLVIGKVADRVRKVKPFVLASGIASGISLMIPLWWPTVGGLTAFNIANGFAFGMYMAVDMALITQVLPNNRDAGKDMGIINIANAAPQVAAPFVAAWIVDAAGYEGMFWTAGLIGIAGALFVIKVKDVK
ncbi:MFS transporter [Yinghuangia soli]|uniref:MFS transporter n=1 Tax=Yinghuangia soli TaxID=2908204 RepID=A0AA41U4K1_9ACTN|nr:MFS transporter [Yinghuangia soli]MCF2529109.1 MFS transporter [Yinghuangia soli]